MKNGTYSCNRAPRFRVLLLAVLIVSIALTLAPANAETQQGVIRNPNGGSYVNVRVYPSYDAYILTELSVGTTVTITGMSNGWYAVYAEGVVGYVHPNFLLTEGSGGTSQMATVTSGPLNVREAPSMNARVVAQLPTGLRVNVLSQEGTWSRIQAAQINGYVVSSYLRIDGSPSNPTPTPPTNTPDANATIRTANGGSLNLRAYASSTAPIVGSYANGSRVRVLTQGASWCRVQVAGVSGYMSTQFLSMDNTITGGNGYDAVVNNPGAGQVLNLRAQPSTSSTSLGQYRNGAAIKVLGVGTDWHRVRVGSVEGYMMAKYVRITSPNATPNKTVTGGANGFVNLRSGASYTHDVLKRVSNGSAATVVVPYALWSDVLVREGSGYMRGFILNTFLR